ncbi:serine/threonine kinase [Aureococcus anophagefferens]|nr:serine/threonine kinase [Aureococcus anophagefferens]
MSWLIRWCAPKQKLDPYDNQDAGERVVDLAFAPPIEVPAEVDETYASSAVDRPETRVAPLWSPRNASPARDVRTVSPEAGAAAARRAARRLPLATPRRDGPAAHLRRPSHALLNGFRGAARAYATGRRGALEQPVNPDELEVLREVGRGAFGRVYLARVRGGGGALFAVKVLRKSSVLAAGGAESVFTERDVARTAKHGFVAQLRCAFQSRLALYLVSDFYPGGSLAELLKRAVRLGAPLPLDDLSWRDVERKRLHPPRAPPLPPFLETRADGELAFASEPSTARVRELGSPRRVTFDEENLTPSKLNQSKADIKASRKRFQGFAFDSKVDLAASPATYRAAGAAY